MSYVMGDHSAAIAAAEAVIAKAGHHPAPYKLLGIVYTTLVSRATTNLIQYAAIPLYGALQ